MPNFVCQTDRVFHKGRLYKKNQSHPFPKDEFKKDNQHWRLESEILKEAEAIAEKKREVMADGIDVETLIEQNESMKKDLREAKELIAELNKNTKPADAGPELAAANREAKKLKDENKELKKTVASLEKKVAKALEAGAKKTPIKENTDADTGSGDLGDL